MQIKRLLAQIRKLVLCLDSTFSKKAQKKETTHIKHPQVSRLWVVQLMLADNSIRFQPVKVQKNKILRHKFLNYLPQKYKFSVHPICTALKNIRFFDFIANYQVVLML